MAQSTAYDLDRMGYAYAPAQPQVAQPPELHVVDNRAARLRVTLRRAAVSFIILMGIVAAILYNQMALTELTAQVESARSEYEALVGENRRTQVELESRTSLRSIQESAEALGMYKAETYQIEYIDLGGGEQVVLTQETPGPLETAAAAVHDWFDGVLEYLGL